MAPPPRRRAGARPTLRLLTASAFAVLVALVALVALASASTAGAASLPASSKGGGKKGGGSSSGHCPNAARCGLATQPSYDELLARLEVVERLVGTVAVSLVRGQAWIGGPSECEAGQGTARRSLLGGAGGSGGNGFVATCLQNAVGPPPSVYLNLRCPSGYNAAVEADCRGDAYAPNGDKIRSLPLLQSGTFSRQSHCEVDTTGLPLGSRVDVIARIKCGAYYDLDDPKNSHVNRGAVSGEDVLEQAVVKKGNKYNLP